MFLTKYCVFASMQKRANLCMLTMTARNNENFKGQKDRYNGITVDSSKEQCNVDQFPNQLQASLSQWIGEKIRTIWFKVDLSHAHWIPTLTENGFKFHHAKEDCATLYRWLPSNETCNVPPYAHTNLGVGAFVYNDKTEEILVVRERHGVSNNFKLPGGYVEPNEDLANAAEREVLEETGITAKFKYLLAFRHAHGAAFGCSDIYSVSFLTPQTFDIQKCDREITECRWMKLEEYVEHPNVHENNRFFARKFIDNIKNGVGLTLTRDVHPLSKKPICVYSLSKCT